MLNGFEADAQVRSWLWNSMEPHISADVVLLDTNYLVFSYVSDSHASHNNINSIYELCEEIFRIKQGSKSLKDYYSFVKGRWEELTLYQPIPQDFATWKRQTERLKEVSFLSGLDAQYGSAKNQLLCGSELLPLNVAFLRLSRIPVQHDAPLLMRLWPWLLFLLPLLLHLQQEGDPGVEGEQVEVVGDPL